MTTVQDLINLHRKAQEYEYRLIHVKYIDGHSEGFSNVNNLHVDGEKISFISTYIPIGQHDISERQIQEIFIKGEIISTQKRIM